MPAVSTPPQDLDVVGEVLDVLGLRVREVRLVDTSTVVRGPGPLVVAGAAVSVDTGDGSPVLGDEGGAVLLARPGRGTLVTCRAGAAGGTGGGPGPLRAAAVVVSGELPAGADHPLLSVLAGCTIVPAAVLSAATAWATSALRDELATPRPGHAWATRHLGALLLLEVLRSATTAPPGVVSMLGDAVVYRALQMVHADASHPWTTEELADRVDVSRATLHRRFTTSVGMAPAEYLTAWRMTLAAKLLNETDLRVAEVSARVGYAAPESFARAFRRRYGTAPRAARRPGASPEPAV